MIYAYVHLKITDKEPLVQYRDVADAALAKHGGALVSANPEITALEGDLVLPNMAAILSFPTKEAALAWINDPELQDVHALRRASGQSTVHLLG